MQLLDGPIPIALNAVISTQCQVTDLAKALFHSPSGDVPQLHVALGILAEDVAPVGEYS